MAIEFENGVGAFIYYALVAHHESSQEHEGVINEGPYTILEFDHKKFVITPLHGSKNSAIRAKTYVYYKSPYIAGIPDVRIILWYITESRGRIEYICDDRKELYKKA